MDRRFSFNEDEENYDRCRPTYPEELFQDVIAYAGLHAASKAIEIGIGTGQATVPILKTGCYVTAIELGDRLSAYVTEKLKTNRNLQVQNADFLDVPMAKEFIDFVYSATAFHWLPEEQAFRKIWDMLKPQGSVALFWNHPFPNRQGDESNQVNRRIYNKYRPSAKAPVEFSQADCEAYVRLLDKYGFQKIQCKLYHRVRTLTVDSYLHLLNTYSDHRALPPEVREMFEQEMQAELEKAGGSINVYDTIDLYLGQKHS